MVYTLPEHGRKAGKPNDVAVATSTGGTHRDGPAFFASYAWGGWPWPYSSCQFHHSYGGVWG